jgi:glyoxylase-like metal-dependent hydrolase (beta-lactamase superfamily II)/rhodanese-related sulfurtransferase
VADIVSLVDEGLGNSSYVVDLGDRRGLVLDPTRDPSGYLELAERRGLKVAYSVETHLHADFVSGSRELAARGATVIASAAGGLEFPYHCLGDGDEVNLGGLRLRALATPGHSPEHLAYLLSDGDRPVGLFSGGSLLVSSVARTDLISPDETEQLARSLWRSIHKRILTLPDDLPVYPAHGAGSFCSAPGGSERTTTIGREKAANPLLGAPNEGVFVKQLLDGLRTYPPYFLRLRDVNRRGPAVYGADAPTLAPLDVEEVRRLLDGGAVVIDARPIDAFAAGHIPGSVSIQLRPAFAIWLGWVVRDDTPLVFVLDDDQDRADLVRQARKVGYEHLAGELAGSMTAWRQAGLPETTTPLVALGGLGDRRILDVRQDSEYTAGHIPGSLHTELGALPDVSDLPVGSVAVTCGHGERAMTGASLLERRGVTDLVVVNGGTSAWVDAGRSLETA